MQIPALLVRLRRPLALFALALTALSLTATARAITNDELIPANLVGKSITLTHAAGAPNRLEATINSYTITFTTASTLTRAATGFSSSGTYKVNSSTLTGAGATRNTFLEFSGWYATGNTAPVSVSLGHSAGEGAGFAFDTADSAKMSIFTFVFGATFTGGGGTTTPAPVLTTQPTAQTAAVGSSVTFTAAANGTGNTYQWRVNGNNIAGATGATYTIASASNANVGLYSVVVTNAGVSTTSGNALLTVVAAATRGRLINLSVLTTLSTATDEFTLGYVVGGTGTTGSKPLVIRAAGPSLGALGVPGTIADPQLETFAGSTKTGGNDNWGGASALAADLAAVGAFAYTGPTSRDAAVSTSISSRDNSVKVTGVAGATGQVIAEVYDATPSANFAATTPRLLNVSVRKHLGTGITAGFVLGGSAPTRVLIRVVGPGLAAFGVGDTVVDPQLALFNDKSVKIGENNDWGGSADLAAAFTSVGAFALPAATSKDAALLVTLQPGLYSVQATGVNNTTGVGIVEVYELP